MNITVNKIGENICGNIGHNRYDLTYTKERFTELNQQLRICNNQIDYDSFLVELDKFKKLISKYVSEDSSQLDNLYAIIHECFEIRGGKFYLKDAEGNVSSLDMPTTLVDMMHKSLGMDIDPTPIIKTWIRFLNNPHLSAEKARLFGEYLTAKYIDEEMYESLISIGYSKETAKEQSSYNEISITNAGLLQTYKYVQLAGIYDENYENYFEFSDISDETIEAIRKNDIRAERLRFLPPIMGTNGDPVNVNGEITHLVRIGAQHSLKSFEQVDCDDRRSCVKGLHLGNLTYIKGYGGRTRFLINAFTCPSDIGAFVQSYGEDQPDAGAIRCLSYYAHSINVVPNKNMYNSSTFGEFSVEEWDVLRRNAVKNTINLKK